MFISKKTLLYFLLLISINICSQNNVIDSLESDLKLHKENDVKRANLLKEIGLYYFQVQDYDKTISHLKNSIDLNVSLGNIEATAVCLKNLGHVYSDMHNFNEALNYYNKALKINRDFNNQEEVANCLNNIGVLYATTTDLHFMAIKYYFEAYDVTIKNKDSLGMLKVLNNLGNLHMLNEKLDKAIENFEKSLDIQKKIKNTSYIGVTLNNLGNIYKKKGESEKGITYLNESLKISKESNDKYTESTALINLGDIYQGLKKYTTAEQYYAKGMELKKEINDDYGLCNSYNGLAFSLIGQKEYRKALLFTQKADEISKKLKIIGLQRDVYDNYTQIYKNTGDYRKALSSHETFKTLSDSLFNKEKVEKIVQLELENKYKESLDSASMRELHLTKAVETTTLNLEKTQRNILLTIIAFLLTVIILAGVIFYLKFRNQKIITDNIIIEQGLLRSQMTPHFIFNAMSVLQGMVLNKEENKAIHYLSKLSKLFRIILENSRDKMVLLTKELEAVEHYLTLQNLEDNTYHYTVNVDESLNISLFKIPPMLIQPFVENAIEHAFEKNNEAKKIEITISFSDKKLLCFITDNGIGVDALKVKNNEDKKSLATTITSERLALLSKDFKMESSITIEDRKIYNETGTKVTLIIPYKLV